MKKIFPWIALIFVLTICYIYYQYQNNKCNLSDLNYAIQIGYNIFYLSIAIAVVYVANNQINKTREATTIQGLTDIANNLKSNDYYKKRQKLADFIINKGRDNSNQYVLKVQLNEFTKLIEFNDIQREEISKIKNIFEDVIYDFAILSYLYSKKRIYSIDDIYFLFSYEVQRFWILAVELGYIDFIRNNIVDGESDFYEGLELLFKETIKYELKVTNKIGIVNKIIYYKHLRFDRLFRIERNSFQTKMDIIIEKKRKNIDLFLLEENNLV